MDRDHNLADPLTDAFVRAAGHQRRAFRHLYRAVVCLAIALILNSAVIIIHVLVGH
jgi:hypothetical protein